MGWAAATFDFHIPSLVTKYQIDSLHMSPPPDTLKSERLELRRARPEHGADLFAVANDPDVMHFMDWPRPNDPAQTIAHLEIVYSAWDLGKEYQWLVYLREGQSPVGTISCRPQGHMADFGYFFGASHWGKGYATEAGKIVLGWLQNCDEIYRVCATTDAENTRSRCVLEKLGLELEGVLKMATVRPNIGPIPRDTAIYGWVRESRG